MAGSYYLVYGVFYSRSGPEIEDDRFRVVAIERDSNFQLCPIGVD